jgi:hypothetical protein
MSHLVPSFIPRSRLVRTNPSPTSFPRSTSYIERGNERDEHDRNQQQQTSFLVQPPRRPDIAHQLERLEGGGVAPPAPSARRSLGGTRAQSGQVSATFQTWTAFYSPNARCKPN